MTATMAGEASRFDIGRVVKRTFDIMGANLGAFVLVSLVFSGLPQLVLGLWRGSIGISPANPFASVGPVALGGLIAGICSMVLQGALIHGAVAELNGRRSSFGEMTSYGLRVFLPVLAIAVISALGMAIGFVLLIVPGVILALAWSVAVPAGVVERTGVFDAFRRSTELTRNHRLSILGVGILFWVMMLVLSAVLGLIIGLVFGLAALGAAGGTTRALAQGVTGFVTGMLITPIGALGAASIYVELKSIKEGVGPEAMASVFD